MHLFRLTAASCNSLAKISLKMKNKRKTTSRFERTNLMREGKKYKYYFFDYLYFKGEEKNGRMSGSAVLFWYYWWIVVLPGYILLINNVSWSCLDLGYLGVMFLFIYVFIHARYKKERVSALANHYRRSKPVGAVQAISLFLLPWVLFFLETWLFDEWGWTDCVRWNK